MYPRLFELGPITVYTYGVLLAAAYLLGLKLAMVRAKARGLDERACSISASTSSSARLSARSCCCSSPISSTFTSDPKELLTLARSGGVFYGGLILAVVVALWYIRKIGLPLWTTCDVFAPGIALGHVVGRFGCLFAGCCFGKPTTRAVGRSRSPIRLPPPMSGRRSDVPLHPTQLYEAGAELIILGVLLVDGAERTRVRRADVLAVHAALCRLALHHRVLSAATSAAMSASSRPRSSSRCSLARWRSRCSSISAAP